MDANVNLDGKNMRWLIYSNPGTHFPYRLFIEEETGTFLSLKVQERWPGPGKKIFCKVDGMVNVDGLPAEEPVEECNIISQKRYGKKLTIILDRKIRKRCWFLFLKREYKTKPGEYYDQTFWITQAAAVGEKRGVYLPMSRKRGDFEVLIDVNERYPYRFGKAKVERKKLPVGDYALSCNGDIVALAERKTLDNFLHEISTMEVFKAKLQEMSLFRYKVVVLESPYANFINPKKLSYYSSPYVAEILADLAVQFPEVQFIFFSNRKTANEWVYRWFQRINQNIQNEDK